MFAPRYNSFNHSYFHFILISNWLEQHSANLFCRYIRHHHDPPYQESISTIPEPFRTKYYQLNYLVMSHSELNYIFKDENNYFLNIFIVNLTFEKDILFLTQNLWSVPPFISMDNRIFSYVLCLNWRCSCVSHARMHKPPVQVNYIFRSFIRTTNQQTNQTIYASCMHYWL
jgi:hypothetical protein